MSKPPGKADNTILTDNQIEIYKNKIYYLVDEYINNELQIDKNDYNNIDDYKKCICNNRIDMFNYISDNIANMIDRNNIDLLNGLFNIFVRVCGKYNINPTLELFGIMVNISACTFSDWMNGDYRASSSHGKTAKIWKDYCKACTVDRLSNQTGTNANLIFIAKAAYGMVETAPQMLTNTEQRISRQTIDEIRERHALTVSEEPPGVWLE